MPHSRSTERVADAQTSEPSPLQVAFNHLLPVRHWPPALGGQLRPPVRLRLRVPPLLCLTSIHLVRAIRTTKEGRADLGVPVIRRISSSMPSTSLLHHSRVRLRGLHVL